MTWSLIFLNSKIMLHQLQIIADGLFSGTHTPTTNLPLSMGSGKTLKTGILEGLAQMSLVVTLQKSWLMHMLLKLDDGATTLQMRSTV